VETTDKITKSIRKEDVERKWWVVDASGKTVGRLSTQVATILRGKHKAYFTPHVDCGDYVIVINAEKINLVGKRPEQKQYFHYTGYPGGDRFESYKELLAKKPEFIVEHAVKGMLPKNRLGRVIIKKLKVYKGGLHPHAAQKPDNLELKYS
jgi:large subunit ribosomal protein L13